MDNIPRIWKYMSEQPMQYIKNKKVLADYWLRPFCLSLIFDLSIFIPLLSLSYDLV
jgi:hypothetical protein